MFVFIFNINKHQVIIDFIDEFLLSYINELIIIYIYKFHSMELKVKIGVFGDSKVGKTSIIQRYITNKFEETYQNKEEYTSEFKYSEQTYKVEYSEINTDNLEHIDKPEQYDFCIFIYDYSNKKTLDNCLKLKNDVEKGTLFFILVNKLDLIKKEERDAKCDEIFSLAPKEIAQHFAPISAKSGEFVKDIFEEVIRKAIFTAFIKKTMSA